MARFRIRKKKTGICRYVPEAKTGFKTISELNSIISNIKTQRSNIDVIELLVINTKIIELKKIVKDAVKENSSSKSEELTADELTEFEKEIKIRRDKLN